MATSNNPTDDLTDAELLAELTEDDEFTTETEFGDTHRWRVGKTKHNEKDGHRGNYRVLAHPIDDDEPSFAEFSSVPDAFDDIDWIGRQATSVKIVRDNLDVSALNEE